LNKTNPSQINSPIDFPALTGIRAVAAYMIFIHHYFGINCDGKLWCSLFLEFHAGVSFFLVLSGFLITLRYCQGSHFKFSWLKKYSLSRFARIYPLYFLLTIISLIVYKENGFEWFLSLTLLKGLFSQYRFIAVSQSWTLTVEVIFYILAPFIFFFHKRGASLFLIFALIFLSGILVASRGQVTNLPAFLSGHIFWFVYTFFGRCFEFFFGISLALAILNKRIIKGENYTFLGLAGVIGTLVLIMTYQSQQFRFGIYNPWGLLIYTFILPAFIAVFYYGLIREKTIISKILSSSLMQLLGKSSYAFYLIHVGVIAEFLVSLNIFNMPGFFVTLNLIAIGLFLFYEKPLNRIIKKLSR